MENALWTQVKEEIRKDLNETSYKVWIDNLKVSEIRNNRIIILTLLDFHLEHIEKSYKGIIQRAFERVTGIKDLKIIYISLNEFNSLLADNIMKLTF